MPPPRLFEGKLDVGARGEGRHRKSVGKGLHDLERALTDGSGGSEYGDVSHEWLYLWYRMETSSELGEIRA